MSCDTPFDIQRDWYPYLRLSWLLIPLVIVAAFRLGAAHEPRMKEASRLAVGMGGVALVAFGAHFIAEIREWHRLAGLDASVHAEGRVTAHRSTHGRGATETFTVDGLTFTYRDDAFTDRYFHSLFGDGPIERGYYVKVDYAYSDARAVGAGKRIVRLAVCDAPRPPVVTRPPGVRPN